MNGSPDIASVNSLNSRRLFFCLTYIGVQLFLILRAHTEVDKRLGFWMFAEASYYRAELFRELRDGTIKDTQNGRWVVPVDDHRGFTLYSWDEWVNDFHLDNLAVRKKAKTGMGITLKYLQHALDQVAQKIAEDADTVRLGLRIEYTKAGGELQKITLLSKNRF